MVTQNPTWFTPFAAALFVVAAVGYIFAAGRPDRRLVWCTKPFAMPLLAVTYVFASSSPDLLILSGLILGAAGDVFLIPRDRSGLFLAGLTAFLLGHIAYTVAFAAPVLRDGSLAAWTLASIIPLAILGSLVYRIIRTGLGTRKAPVVVYIAVVLAMALAAMLRASSTAGAAFWLPLVGAFCFVASDTMLAFQRFRRSVRSGNRFVAISYVLAQMLIVAGYVAMET